MTVKVKPLRMAMTVNDGDDRGEHANRAVDQGEGQGGGGDARKGKGA